MCLSHELLVLGAELLGQVSTRGEVSVQRTACITVKPFKKPIKNKEPKHYFTTGELNSFHKASKYIASMNKTPDPINWHQ